MATSSSTDPDPEALGFHETESSSPSTSPLPHRMGKKRRRHGHIDSKYRTEWSLKYQGIKRSDKGCTYAFCSLCIVDISVAGGGIHQIKRHCASKKHCSILKDISSQPTIQDVVGRESEAVRLKDQVCRAELCFVRFVTEHNLPFAVADHFNSLCSIMFHDSKIAAKLACARTKTATLITHALAPAANERIIKALSRQPFTILCDGGNDNFEKNTLESWLDTGMRNSRKL